MCLLGLANLDLVLELEDEINERNMQLSTVFFVY